MARLRYGLRFTIHRRRCAVDGESVRGENLSGTVSCLPGFSRISQSEGKFLKHAVRSLVVLFFRFFIIITCSLCGSTETASRLVWRRQFFGSSPLIQNPRLKSDMSLAQLLEHQAYGARRRSASTLVASSAAGDVQSGVATHRESASTAITLFST